MNKQQRKELGAMQDRLSALTDAAEEVLSRLDAEPPADLKELFEGLSALSDDVDEVKGVVDATRCDEEDKYDNMIEAIKDGEKGDQLQEIMEYLQEAQDQLDEAMDLLKPRAEYAVKDDLQDMVNDLVEVLTNARDNIDSAICV